MPGHRRCSSTRCGPGRSRESPFSISAPARRRPRSNTCSARWTWTRTTPPSARRSPASDPCEDLDGGEEGLLLVDANGLRLGGRLADDPGDPAGDRVAAQLAGLSREAARATRLLGLGSWPTIAVES